MPTNLQTTNFNYIIVGAGIIGLAYAYTLRKKGFSVLVLEQHKQAIGATIRNFGYVTVSGQARGDYWALSKRSSEIWRKISKEAGINVAQTGALITARSEAAKAVLDEFMLTEMGQDCNFVDRNTLLSKHEYLSDNNLCAIYSPHELRIESQTAVPKLTAYLTQLGVEFSFDTRVYSIKNEIVNTSKGDYQSEQTIVCSGIDIKFLYPKLWEKYQLTICKLHMQILTPAQPIIAPHTIMSDLSLIFYMGFSELAATKELLEQIKSQNPQAYQHLIHIIAAQNADGSFMVGDSHEYLQTEEPFANIDIMNTIQNELKQIFKQQNWRNKQTWLGYYPYSENYRTVYEKLNANVSIALVNRGKGMTIGFAMADKSLAHL